MKIYLLNENSSFLWKFFTVLKIDLCDGIHHWWKFIIVVKLINVTKINHVAEKLSVWGKLIIVLKALSYDENSSSRWEFFIVINSDIVIKVYHCNEIILLWWKFSLWCKFITWWIVLLLWKFIVFMNIHHCYENSSID